MEPDAAERCPACGAPGFEAFLELPPVPVHVGVLWPSAEAARSCPRGEVSLALCARCGFVGNPAFDPARVDYGLRYDNALHFSPFFRRYEEALARRLVERYGLRGRDVIEIGCGSGRFLGLLCALGGNRGVGFDPSFDPQRADPGLEGRAEVVRDYYGERYAGRAADLVCCRHALEHLPEPRAFLEGLRRTLDARPEAVVYVEVPNALFVLRDLSVWDVIYEHCGYWSPGALASAFRRSGFEVLACGEDYEGQFVGIEARPAPAPVDAPGEDAARVAEHARAFAAHFGRLRREWSERLDALARAGKRVALWGAGAKAVSFLNLLELGERVDAVVDLNPAKQGSHLAGTGQRILAPEELKERSPDLVLVLNPAYRDEIAASLRGLGLAAEVRTV